MPDLRARTEVSGVAELSATLEVLRSSSEDALRSASEIARRYVIAGYRIELRFAGPALLPAIEPAFAHHAEFGPHDGVDLTVSVWDSASTGVALPPIPWVDAPAGHEKEIRIRSGAGLRAVHRMDEGDLSLLDEGNDVAFMWIPDASDVPFDVYGAPLRMILLWWMRLHDLHLIHAAAVGTQTGGVLIPGSGGSGKSTTALACVLGGLRYASDDHVLLDVREEPFAHSLYATGKLQPRHAERFPDLAAQLRPPLGPDEKALLFLNEFEPAAPIPGFPLRAVVAPKIVDGVGARVVPISRGRALATLAPSTILSLPGARGAGFPAMTELVASVPSYVLEIGSDLSAIAPAVLGLLEELR